MSIPVKRDTFRSNSPSNEDFLESHKDTNKSTSTFRKHGREKKKQAKDNGIAIQNGETIGFRNDDGNEVEVIGNGNVPRSHRLNDGEDRARNFFKDDIGDKDVDISGGAFEEKEPCASSRECSLASIPLDIEVVVSDEE